MTTKTAPTSIRFWTYHREGIVRVTVTEDRPVTLLTGDSLPRFPIDPQTTN